MGLERSTGLALSAMERLAQKLKVAGKSAVEGMSDTFINGLARGDLAGAVKDAISGYAKDASKATGDIIKSAFSGGGLASITTSIKGAFTGIKAALSGGGGFFASLSGVASSALPLIGIGQAIIGLFRGFSSKTVTGSGLNLSVKDGGIDGSEYTNIQKKSWWGLRTKNYTEYSALSGDLTDALNSSLSAVQGNLQSLYERAGKDVTSSMIKAFSFDFGQIDTRGKTQDQINAEIEAKFVEYQDGLSNAIGGIGIKAVAALADVTDILHVAGAKLQGSFVDMANSATALVDLFGDANGLNASVSNFVDKFYTDKQKLDLVNKNVKDTFAELNLALPKTNAGFRNLVLSQDLMTEAGRANYAALLGIADAFAYSTDAKNDAKDKKAEKAAEAQAELNAATAAAAEAAAKRVEDAFASMDGRFVNEFDARLAKAGQINGYDVRARVLVGGAIDRVRVGQNDEGNAMLLKMYRLWDKWDTQGMPNGSRI
jgi:hypothetical protein